ncbi:MAG: AMP-binding protein [Planctomycetota bacterium]
MLGTRSLFAMLRGLTRELLIDDRRSYRGIDLLTIAMHIADTIDAHSSSQRIAIMLPTSGAFTGVISGVWFAGRTAVPLNYLLKSEELQYVIDDSGTDLLIASRQLCETLGIEPEAKRIVWIEDIRFKSAPTPRWPRRCARDDTAVVLYTSGTSGRPKGVMLSHNNLWSNVTQIREHENLGPRDVFLGVLPQFHSFGLTALTLLPFFTGAKAVYNARFTPRRIVDLFKEHKPTVFFAIPSMYNALMTVKGASPEDFDSLRMAVSGGEPLSDTIAGGCRERLGIEVCEGYGMTESSPVTHCKLAGEDAPGSVGRPLPRVVQRIIDESTGRDLPPGVDGELRLSGPNIMLGYLNLPAETAAAFDEQGFLRTGDMARVDGRGFLWITGRIKEMLIVGGENVFPREIEEVIDAHPDIRSVGVIGEPDPMRGEVPVAFVEPEDGREPDPDAIRAWCRDRLAGYKVPKRVVLVEELPRNPTGKVVRRALKELL